MNSIFTRRSIRNYKSKEIEEEKIDRILRAAMQSPSAGNQRPWEFIVVKDKLILKQLSKMSPYSGMLVNAGVAIIMLSNEERLRFPENWEQDMGACAQTLLLQVVEEELGGVWLGVAPLQDRERYVSDLLGIPSKLKVFSVMSIGYPNDDNKFVNRYEKERIHYEKY